MADFDPDTYLAKKRPAAGGGFDPDAYLAQRSGGARPLNAEVPAPKPEAPGLGQTIAEHGLGGYFANYSDELAGQMSRLDPRLQQPGAAMEMPDGSVKFIRSGDDAAAATQATMRDSLKQSAEAHPVAAFLSNMGGELLRDATLAGVGVPVGSLPFAIASGALSGSGAADDEMPGGKIGGAVLGAGAGALGGALGAKVVGPAIGFAGRKVLGAIPDAVKEFAERRAFKAAGPMLKNFRELAAQGRDKDIGRDLLDEHVVKFGSDVDAISKNASARAKSIGEAIGEARDVIDRIVPEGALPTGKQLADRIESEVLTDLRASPIYQPYVAAVEGYAERFRALGDEPISLNTLTKWKAQMNDLISHPPDPNFPLRQKQAVARVLKDTEDDLVQNVAGTAPAAEYEEGKRLYGNLANVADFASDKALREQANRIVSPSDHAFGAVAAMGDIAKGGSAGEASLWGMAMALANKLARERGNAAAAVTLDALADSAPMQWLRMLPAAQGQKYLVPIANAALRGPQALAATVFALSQQDPDFRALKEQAQGR